MARPSRSRNELRNGLAVSLSKQFKRPQCWILGIGFVAFVILVQLLFPFLSSHGHADHSSLLEHLETSVIQKNHPAKRIPKIQDFFFQSQITAAGDMLPGATLRTVEGSSICRSKNAFVFLAQKKHSTYGRDSLELLLKTLDLFRDNYLSIGNHRENVDVFLFHTGDFGDTDLLILERRLNLNLAAGNKNPAGVLRMVNLKNTAYWSLPELFKHDNQTLWKGSEIYPLGYRHMCRWFGMQLWYFFRDLNKNGGCKYRYIARLDEDSFILSPIRYDMFELMQSQQYVYGYRMCAYELEDMPKLWYRKWRKSMKGHMQRNITKDLCGFYTNFFVADLEFFLLPKVSDFLSDIDQRGFYYRKRFGDLLVHSLAVYAFAEESRIHRFLDFTYQHATIDYFKDAEKQCISWGSIQAGYNDPNGEKTVEQFYEEHVLKKDCPTANMTYISEENLSPTYAHIPDSVRQHHPRISLKTVHAGLVELPNRGILSG